MADEPVGPGVHIERFVCQLLCQSSSSREAGGQPSSHHKSPTLGSTVRPPTSTSHSCTHTRMHARTAAHCAAGADEPVGPGARHALRQAHVPGAGPGIPGQAGPGGGHAGGARVAWLCVGEWVYVWVCGCGHADEGVSAGVTVHVLRTHACGCGPEAVWLAREVVLQGAFGKTGLCQACSKAM